MRNVQDGRNTRKRARIGPAADRPHPAAALRTRPPHSAPGRRTPHPAAALRTRPRPSAPGRGPPHPAAALRT